jgi:hypothetical protein
LLEAYIAEASQHPGYTFAWSINSRNEVHARANPVEWPHNCKLKVILSSLSCKNRKRIPVRHQRCDLSKVNSIERRRKMEDNKKEIMGLHIEVSSLPIHTIDKTLNKLLGTSI